VARARKRLGEWAQNCAGFEQVQTAEKKSLQNKK
jgi:hypothetical protein